LRWLLEVVPVLLIRSWGFEALLASEALHIGVVIRGFPRLHASGRGPLLRLACIPAAAVIPGWRFPRLWLAERRSSCCLREEIFFRLGWSLNDSWHDRN